MGQWTIVIHGTGAHHNWATTPDPSRPAGSGHELIAGRKNDYDADLMFAEFVDGLKAKGHTITGATFTHGGMEGAENVICADYQNPHLPKPEPKPFVPNVYELCWGGDRTPEQARYFDQSNMVDAVVRLSERVMEMDRNPAISAAWVHLRRVKADGSDESHGGEWLAAWTKCSDERPTSQGAELPADAN